MREVKFKLFNGPYHGAMAQASIQGNEVYLELDVYEMSERALMGIGAKHPHLMMNVYRIDTMSGEIGIAYFYSAYCPTTELIGPVYMEISEEIKDDLKESLKRINEDE